KRRMTDIRRLWQQSEDGAAKAAPFSLQVTAYSSKRVAAYSAAQSLLPVPSWSCAPIPLPPRKS
ncbi:hypothetical protein ACCT09_54025, partial [Rhizobium ruizarguesonis]